MTPQQIMAIDIKEIKEVEILCDCGASLKFSVPLKNELIDEMTCLGCKRSMWAHGSFMYQRIKALLATIEAWCSMPQPTEHHLELRFVLTEPLEHDA